MAADYKLSTVPALFVIDAEGSLAFVLNPVREDATSVARKLEDAIRAALEGDTP